MREKSSISHCSGRNAMKDHNSPHLRAILSLGSAVGNNLKSCHPQRGGNGATEGTALCISINDHQEKRTWKDLQ